MINDVALGVAKMDGGNKLGTQIQFNISGVPEGPDYLVFQVLDLENWARRFRSEYRPTGVG